MPTLLVVLSNLPAIYPPFLLGPESLSHLLDASIP